MRIYIYIIYMLVCGSRSYLYASINIFSNLSLFFFLWAIKVALSFSWSFRFTTLNTHWSLGWDFLSAPWHKWTLSSFSRFRLTFSLLYKTWQSLLVLTYNTTHTSLEGLYHLSIALHLSVFCSNLRIHTTLYCLIPI